MIKKKHSCIQAEQVSDKYSKEKKKRKIWRQLEFITE